MPEESVNSLQYAFIFDRRLDVADESAEDQEKLEQVLYFWPTNTPAFQQNVRVSLCSGVLDFCHSFSGEAIVDGVQMEEQYYSFFECEKDIWMVWVVSNPKQLVISGRRKGTLSKTEQMRNIFHPDTLRDHLRSVHDLYRLFHGSLRSAIAPDGDLSIMHDLMAKRRQLRKALEMQEKLADEAVARTEANLSRAQAASTFQRELKAMEAGSTVTKVRRQLRQIVSQFMNASFTQRWDHHAFGYLRDVVRSQVSRFTLLSVQYFSSTVKTGLDGVVKNLALFNDNQLVWSDYNQRVLNLIGNALQSPSFSKAWSQSERMSFPFLLDSGGRVMAKRILIDQPLEEVRSSPLHRNPVNPHLNRAKQTEQVLVVYYQAPITLCLGLDPAAWDTQWEVSAEVAEGKSPAETKTKSLVPPLCERIQATIRPELRKLSRLIDRTHKGNQDTSSRWKSSTRAIVRNINNGRLRLFGFDGGSGKKGDATVQTFAAVQSVLPQLSQECLYLLDNALSHMENRQPKIWTQMVKTASRQWIVCLQSGERQIFVIFDSDSEYYTLLEANKFVYQLMQGPLHDMYLL